MKMSSKKRGENVSIAKMDIIPQSKLVDEDEAWTLLMIAVAKLAWEDFVLLMRFLEDGEEAPSNESALEAVGFNGSKEDAKRAARECLLYADSGICPITDGAAVFKRNYMRIRAKTA